VTDLPLDDLLANLGWSALAVVVLLAGVMALALRLRNQSIIDAVWGPGFVVVAAVSYLLSAGDGGDGTRRLVVLLLTAAWGLRLGLHVGIRNRGKGEDRRYTALMRKRTGPLVPFLVRKIYGFQGVVMWVVSLPVQVAMYQSTPLGLLGWFAVALWVVGFLFEAVGDWQLVRFKADPANEGAIMDRGLWSWTRHPNYFGDCCVWIALFLLALGHPLGLLTVVSPLLMTWLLVRGSGAALLERGMTRRRGQAYADYVARTSGFFPRPPKRTAVGEPPA
jgi:steroid 5-alpha reductase family enzyme